MKHWADGGETSLRNTVLLCRRHHRRVHEGRVKMGRSPDGTVLFFTRSGRVLADAPPLRRMGADSPAGRVGADVPAGRRCADALVGRLGADAPAGRVRAGAARPGGQTDARMSPESSPTDLPPIPSARPGAPSRGERVTLSNGAALYRDAAIPWPIEAAAREAVEESLESGRKH